MTQSSLTEETAATPGWVDRRINEAFAPLGPSATAVADTYAACLASVRGATDVDLGHDGCRQAALSAVDGLADAPGQAVRDQLDKALQALEAELSAST